MLCGKLGTSFGLSPRGVGNKVILDTNKETLRAGAGIKLPTGLLEREVEGQINWKTMKKDANSMKENVGEMIEELFK